MDKERDFDMILSDAIKELAVRREAMKAKGIIWYRLWTMRPAAKVAGPLADLAVIGGSI